MGTVCHSVGGNEVDTGPEEGNREAVPCLEESVSKGTYNSQPRANDAEENNNSDNGYMHYGCHHYRRRCRIRAPCCNEIFDCRHCHNEVKNSINVESSCRHQLPRHQVRQVICSLCNTEQEVSKKQYHCTGCGICRTGGTDQYFHCLTCGCCYSVVLKNSHPCVERAMHHNCPICFEYLFDSTDNVVVLPCGHTIHMDCLKEMQHHLQYACPLCSKSVMDMSKVWEKLDMEIASMPMPESYQNKRPHDPAYCTCCSLLLNLWSLEKKL